MEAWFDPQMAGKIGGILGSAIGIWVGCILGGMSWFYIKKGWKKFTCSLYIFTLLAGLVILGIGLTALFTGQPYHVWYPFILTGAITSFLTAGFFIMIRRLFAQRERQVMAIKDL